MSIDFGKNLRKLRLEQKITAKKLGLELGHAEATITAWERGEKEPNIDTIKAIALFLNASMDELFECGAYSYASSTSITALN